RVPNFLIGENPFLSEVAFKYQVPLEDVMGGAETLYQEWRAKGMSLASPTVQAKIVPVYTDASSKIAELADAQPRRAPSYDKVEAQNASGNVYMLGGAGANIALSAGGDGIAMGE